jgi:hypothetical protein
MWGSNKSHQEEVVRRLGAIEHRQQRARELLAEVYMRPPCPRGLYFVLACAGGLAAGLLIGVAL